MHSEQILIEVAVGAMDSYSSSVQGACATQTVSAAKVVGSLTTKLFVKAEMASQTWSTVIERESMCGSE